jgi:hypothetical protein
MQLVDCFAVLGYQQVDQLENAVSFALELELLQWRGI